MRLVLQGYTLDGSGAFRRRRRTPCTVWPRTVMRGKSRKLTSGPDSVPKSARRTEPSPRNSRFAARPKGVAARRKVRGVKRGQETILGVLSPFVPAGEHRHPPPPKAANVHAHFERKAASSGKPLDQRKVCRLLTVKKKEFLPLWGRKKQRQRVKPLPFCAIIT